VFYSKNVERQKFNFRKGFKNLPFGVNPLKARSMKKDKKVIQN